MLLTLPISFCRAARLLCLPNSFCHAANFSEPNSFTIKNKTDVYSDRVFHQLLYKSGHFYHFRPTRNYFDHKNSNFIKKNRHSVYMKSILYRLWIYIFINMELTITCTKEMNSVFVSVAT